MKYLFMLMLFVGNLSVFSKLKFSSMLRAPNSRKLPMFVVMLAAMLVASPSYGLGLGEVKLDSYIGEQLAASIPVLSVADTSSLIVEITPLNSVVLQSSIQATNNQVSIRITSEQLINEPYVQFSLKVVDQTQILVREFTALLDIRQKVVSSSQNINAATPYNAPQVSPESIVNSLAVDVLGPYEWAQKGQIPARFGPVLDGQSLWRVARRINSAMGVSNDQMMWALYTNNPSAFSDNTIESLRAGVYLDIPKIYQVSNTNSVQAKQNLDLASANTMIVQPADDVAPVSVAEVDQSAEVGLDEVEESIAGDLVESDSTIAEVDPVDAEFKLSGIDEISNIDPNNQQGANQQAIETINVLSVTVGHLTQELISKDKRIEFLEEKIIALESVAELDSIALESTSTVAAISENSVAPPNRAVATVTTPTANVATTTSQKLIKPWMLWLGLLMIALLGTVGLRNKFKSANVFGRVDNIDFPTQMSSPPSVNQEPEGRNFSDMTESRKENVRDEDEADDEEIDDNSFDEISINYIDDDTVDFHSEAEEVASADFEEKLDSLRQQDNFDGVVELIESSRNNLIDDDRYYFERLRCYYEKKDEDAFYAFYDEIEYVIQRFPENWNRQISEMVIKLGQSA